MEDSTLLETPNSLAKHRYDRRPSPPFDYSNASFLASHVEPIYPSLLEQARLKAKEHLELSKRLSSTYDAATAKKAGELAPIAEALRSWEKAQDVSRVAILDLNQVNSL
jgi:hypothetical protein